jgi:hypothetical protein
VRLICAVTPANASAELARLTEAYEKGAEPSPSWRYDPPIIRSELCHALDALARLVENEPPLGPLYATRARELLLEAAMIDAVGTPKLRALARQRFATTDGDEIVRADRLARTLLERSAGLSDAEREPASASDELILSDDRSDRRSLVSQAAAEIGRQRLPLRIVIREDLASLAATGDGVLFIAPGRKVREVDVRRTVLHEIVGHALPRLRAEEAPIGLFAIGTARGVDDQEGRALLLERDAGFFDGERIRELALRHLAARAMFDGATFVDIVRLLRGRGAPAALAVRVVSRVMRGGRGDGSGIGREIVYLAAMLRVERARATLGRIVETTMYRGRIAADAVPAIAYGSREPIEPTFVNETFVAGEPPADQIA